VGEAHFHSLQSTLELENQRGINFKCCTSEGKDSTDRGVGTQSPSRASYDFLKRYALSQKVCSVPKGMLRPKRHATSQKVCSVPEAVGT
jgi:hypothetical protein